MLDFISRELKKERKEKLPFFNFVTIVILSFTFVRVEKKKKMFVCVLIIPICDF